MYLLLHSRLSLIYTQGIIFQVCLLGDARQRLGLSLHRAHKHLSLVAAPHDYAQDARIEPDDCGSP